MRGGIIGAIAGFGLGVLTAVAFIMIVVGQAGHVDFTKGTTLTIALAGATCFGGALVLACFVIAVDWTLSGD